MNKTELLQAAWDETGDLMEATIEFRPTRGWWARPHEPRNFGDPGEFLGDDFSRALRSIDFLKGRPHSPSRKHPVRPGLAAHEYKDLTPNESGKPIKRTLR